MLCDSKSVLAWLFLQAVLDDPQKLAYMKDRIPLGRLGEPEDVAGKT